MIKHTREKLPGLIQYCTSYSQQLVLVFAWHFPYWTNFFLTIFCDVSCNTYPKRNNMHYMQVTFLYSSCRVGTCFDQTIQPWWGSSWKVTLMPHGTTLLSWGAAGGKALHWVPSWPSLLLDWNYKIGCATIWTSKLFTFLNTDIHGLTGPCRKP